MKDAPVKIVAWYLTLYHDNRCVVWSLLILLWHLMPSFFFALVSIRATSFAKYNSTAAYQDLNLMTYQFIHVLDAIFHERWWKGSETTFISKTKSGCYE